MGKELGHKVRQLRELKGYSQEYMAERLEMSQRSYSKLECNETKLDWNKISDIASILEIDPIDLVNFDDSFIFNNCSNSGKAHIMNNYIPDQLIDQYEKRIKNLEDEVAFLRKQIQK